MRASRLSRWPVTGAVTWGILLEVVFSLTHPGIEVMVVVEVEGVEVEVEVLEPSWPQPQLAVVCKVLFFMLVYLVEFFLILVHRIHSYLGSFV